MAIYRTVSMSFWTDNKVSDDFTPEDRYFYLYLFTNPHTNLCGCYEISVKQISNETGYSKDSVENLINRFENIHKVLLFSKETKEILLLNWHKYNWTSSEKFRKPLYKEIQSIKCNGFKKYLQKAYDGEDVYGIDTTYIDTSVTDTDTVNNIYNELLNNFNIIYKSYPKKVGKTKGFEHYKAWVTKGREINGIRYHLNNKQIWDAIANYKREIEKNGTELQFVKQFDTFMCKAILDYVEDKND